MFQFLTVQETCNNDPLLRGEPIRQDIQVRQCHSCGPYQTSSRHQEPCSIDERKGDNPHPVISVFHISVDYLSCHQLDQGDWALRPDILNLICQKWGTLDKDNLSSRFNNKLLLFVARIKDPLVPTLDALIILWCHFRLIYAFPPV